MVRVCALVTLLFAATCLATAAPIMVDCGAGQSLNSALAKLDKFAPATVTVKGTCTEYVVVNGFNQLTLNGVRGSALQQPDSTPPSDSYVLSIQASRSITVSGLAIHGLPSLFSAIGVGGGSNDVRIQNVSTDGPWGVVVFEASQVWLVNVTVNTSGFAGISAFDKSDVHIVNGLIERPADSNFDAGLLVASGHVTMQGTVIRDMQQSIDIDANGSVDLVYFDTSVPSHNVILNNPAGTNYNGVRVTNGSSLNLGSVKLQIINAGQPYGFDTGAVFISDGSAMNAAANLEISGSQGQGVFVANNSHAALGGSSITGGSHGGLVVVNLSTATVTASNPLTVIGRNATDVFCDSKSEIAGSVNIASATTVQCTNLLSDVYESLP